MRQNWKWKNFLLKEYGMSGRNFFPSWFKIKNNNFTALHGRFFISLLLFFSSFPNLYSAMHRLHGVYNLYDYFLFEY